MLSRIKVGQRLTLITLIPIVILAVVVASAVNIFGIINQGVESIYEDRVVPLEDLKSIADDYAVLVIGAVNKANAGRLTAEEALKSVIEAEKGIGETWQKFTATHLTDEEARLVDEAESLFVDANRAIADAIQFLQGHSGNVEGQLNDYDGPLYDQIGPISSKITELVDLQLRVAGEERDRISALTDSLTTTYIISTVIAAVVLVIVSYLIRQSIVGPLDLFRDAMSTIEKTSDVTIKIALDSNDEIGETAKVFNRMMGRIDQLLGQVKTATVQLGAASEELSSIAIQTNDATQKQQHETDQVATAVNEMSATVQDVAKSTTEAQQAAQSADNLATDGRSMVDRNLSLTGDLTNELRNTASIVQKLESESQDIGSVVDVINGIAEQTNLLALNAAIEAARAGEQGRGFAVVADEVRTLAQRTQQSTQEIRDVVDRLQQGARAAVSAMNSGQEKAEDCNEAIEKTQDALKQIEEAVQSIRDMNIQIATALEEQTVVAEDINRNVSTISQISVESASAGANMSESSQHLAELSTALQGQVNQFKISG